MIYVSRFLSFSVFLRWIISRFTGRVRDVINMGSYNYLGFSGTESGCIETVTSTLEENGIGICGTRQEFGMHLVFFTIL